MTPEIVDEYVKFCKIRDKALRANSIDLSQYSFFHPTCLLPLSNFLKYNKNSMHYSPPPPHVSNYISAITEATDAENASYLPISSLPRNPDKVNDIIHKLEEFHENGVEYGGRNAFNYVISELIDNIYQHSEFNNASVMAQRYKTKCFVEMSIFDDGISIPSCFENHGKKFKNDCDAIVDAMNGMSTKSDERGYGLPTTTNLYVNGCHGELFLVSRDGALYKNKNEQILYASKGIYSLKGTLITIRIPYPVPEVDIYNYIS